MHVAARADDSTARAANDAAIGKIAAALDRMGAIAADLGLPLLAGAGLLFGALGRLPRAGDRC